MCVCVCVCVCLCVCVLLIEFNHFLPQNKDNDKSCYSEEAKAKKDIDLQDCLKLFTKEETLSSDNEWYLHNLRFVSLFFFLAL